MAHCSLCLCAGSWVLALLCILWWRKVIAKSIRQWLTNAYPLPIARNTVKLSQPLTKRLEDLPKLIQQQEQQFNLIKGSEKLIQFHHQPSPLQSNLPPKKTELSIIYIHGWSTCRQDSSPLPERIASSLSANLFLTRLSGHGHHINEHPEIGGLALKTLATAHNLFQDALTAINIGLQLGERVVLLGSSTGAALCTWLSCQPCFHPHIAAMVLMSPAFALVSPLFPVLKWVDAVNRVLPWGLAPVVRRALAVAVIGKERIIRPRNHENQTFWTIRYPSEAIGNLVDVLWEIESLDLSLCNCPTMYIGNPFDDAVSYTEMLRRFGKLGSKIKVFLSLTYSHDPHILVGRIMSPNTVDECEVGVVSFLKTYANHVEMTRD